MKRRVLIIDNAIHRFLFKPPWHWKACLRGTAVDVVNAPSGHPLPDLGGYTHVILTGSEASLLAQRPWFEEECRLIRDAAHRGIPLLGSCFGHQMLVYALSGPAALRPSKTPEVGWVSVDVIEPDELLADVPHPWHVFSFHFDEVADPPTPWKILARSDRCAVHALRYGNRPIWGIQAHPEISERKAEFLARLYLLVCGRAGRRAATDFRRPAVRDRAVHSIVRRFLSVGPAV